jgi:hypothetical protein
MKAVGAANSPASPIKGVRNLDADFPNARATHTIVDQETFLTTSATNGFMLSNFPELTTTTN